MMQCDGFILAIKEMKWLLVIYISYPIPTAFLSEGAASAESHQHATAIKTIQPLPPRPFTKGI